MAGHARAKFIVLDGPEGCGKSTHAARLTAWLQSLGKSVLRTREPGGTALGKRVRPLLLANDGPRAVLRAELFLFLADRAQHVEEVILPALQAGQWVISDRFSMSTLAYQAVAHDLDLEAVRAMDEFARQGLTPDLTIVLDVPAEVGLSRLTHARNDRIEERGLDFHRRVRDGFLALARSDPRCVVIDASASEEQVWTQVQSAVSDRLLAGGTG